jgi:hypothetical protein
MAGALTTSVGQVFCVALRGANSSKMVDGSIKKQTSHLIQRKRMAGLEARYEQSAAISPITRTSGESLDAVAYKIQNTTYKGGSGTGG